MQTAGTLTAYVERYQAHRIKVGAVSRASARRQQAHLDRLARTFGARPLSQLGRASIDAFLADMVSAQLADSTRRQAFSTVKGFCAWLVATDVIRRDPTAGMKPPRVAEQEPVTCEQEEVVELWRVAPDARGRLVVLLAVQLMLRCVEISRLTLADVGQRRVRVRGKFGKERYVPLVPEVKSALDEYLVVRGVKAGPLIQSYSQPGSGLTAQYISRMVVVMMYDAGIKDRPRDGKGAHALRRTGATDMQDRGVDAAVGSKILGHTDLSSWNRYGRVRTELMEKAIAGRVYTRRESNVSPIRGSAG